MSNDSMGNVGDSGAGIVFSCGNQSNFLLHFGGGGLLIFWPKNFGSSRKQPLKKPSLLRMRPSSLLRLKFLQYDSSFLSLLSISIKKYFCQFSFTKSNHFFNWKYCHFYDWLKIIFYSFKCNSNKRKIFDLILTFFY